MIENDKKFFDLINDSQSILVIQPDRPDGDSLASALLLENVLEQIGKQVYLYCGVNIPEYIRFIPGWDRASPDLPMKADMSILVDNSSLALLEKFDKKPESISFKGKPFVIADHHSAVECDIPYATLNISRPNHASAGELLYTLFKENNLAMDLPAKKLVMQSILSDTLGLTSDLATAQTYRIMAELIESGVNRAELEDLRREYSKMDERVFRYKAELMQRTELISDDQIAICVITEDEAYDVGTLYNPGPLILGELLMLKNIKVAIAIKTYKKRLTAAIRCTHGNPIAHNLADQFGGGGHEYSAGFKIENWDSDLNSVKSQIITKLADLLK
jgi:bifunctional oligoribonuclease and PAP phosphatase NrnA